MSAHPSTQKLREFQDDRLGADESAEVAAHVELCPECQQALDRLTPFGEGAEDETPVEGAAGGEGGPAGWWPAVEGYEMLGELGHGGMGVVFKARQIKAGRLVALKMVLAGSHVGPDELARFRKEATAAAGLTHPGIVQIYEVGEQDGLPFFSLEFCPGGSLKQKLGGTPLPPREAAGLVAALAEAMQEAHRQGIVHRDLKPANVLLTADGRPKVADFGLAKQLSEPGLTASGAIVGTPSYMAPEQAVTDQGRREPVGPAADVYALGAVLYECLTGRPPFSAPTALDTLLLVLGQEPLPPGRLQPGLPRDLETVCLKCLRKWPRERYASARDLAEDLHRFLGGRPIRARRAGVTERLVKLVRRNPVLTALAGLVVVAVLGGTAASLAFGLRAAREATVARTERARAERNAVLRLRTLDDVLHLVAGPRLRRAGQLALRRQILEQLLPLYEEVLRLEDLDDATREQQALAWNALAVIRRDFGQDADALKAARQAEAIFRDLAGRPDRPASARAGLATALSHQGALLGQRGELTEAIRALDEADRLLTELLAEGGDAPALRYRLAHVHNNWANCLRRAKQPPEAVAHYRQGVAHFDALARAQPAELGPRDWHARTLSNLALLYAEMGRKEEARGASREAVAVARRLAADFRGEIDGRDCLATCLSNEGELQLGQADTTAALPVLGEAKELYEGLSRQVPASFEYRWGLAMAGSNVGAALAGGPRAGWPQAAEHYRRADTMYQELLKANPNNEELKLYVEENRKRWQELEARRRAGQ
jgi:serine/threonine-protein kinase